MNIYKMYFLRLLPFCLLCSLSKAQYDGGAGTQDDPFLISSAEQMNAIGTEPLYWDKHFRLTADIDLSQYTGEQFNMIGSADQPFSGVFDGSGHDISNFTYRCITKDYVALFRYVQGNNAEIRNLSMTDPNIALGSIGWAKYTFHDFPAHEASVYTAALVAYVHEGLIENCHIHNGRILGFRYTGGLVGQSSDKAIIRHCHSFSLVSARTDVGGLVGLNAGKMSQCYTRGYTNCWEVAGGLVGTNTGLITTCYSHCQVSDYSLTAILGGLVGHNDHGQIRECYSTGFVRSPNGTSGLIGDAQSNHPTEDSFWDIHTSHQKSSSGHGEIGKTISAMMQRATYVNWDFDNIWDIAENQTYPFFRKAVPGDLNRDGLVDFDDLMILIEHWTQDNEVKR